MTPYYQAGGKYSIIYADPPWWYSNRSAKRITKFGGGARAHYPVMKDADILALAGMVNELAADNCALCLWGTCPRQDFVHEVLRTWGFKFSTVLFTWVKTRKNGLPIWGPGGYTLSNTEYVLLGIRGSMPPVKRGEKSTIFYPRLRHSEKPPVVRDEIVTIFGDLPRIELFARMQTPGWDCWGFETDKFEPQLAQSRLEL